MNNQARMRRGSVTALLLIVVGVGCARGRRPELPKTYPVTGVVSSEGKPVPGATVMFNPAAGGHGAIAVTDPAGRYKLTTFKPGDGVVPGDYKVAITKTVLGGAADANSPMAVAPDPRNVLPAKYADDSTSGFTATVEAKPDNTFDFALTK